MFGREISIEKKNCCIDISLAIKLVYLGTRKIEVEKAIASSYSGTVFELIKLFSLMLIYMIKSYKLVNLFHD